MPIDAKCRVVPGHCPLRFWMIKVITFILKYGLWAQYTKTMRTATWNKKLTMISFRQFYGYVLSIRGRTTTDIHSHIKHRALDYTHQLGLCIRWLLKMQATHHAVGRLTFVVLHKHRRNHFRIKLLLVERLKEITSCIPEQARFNNNHSGYPGFYYIHMIITNMYPFLTGSADTAHTDFSTSGGQLLPISLW